MDLEEKLLHSSEKSKSHFTHPNDYFDTLEDRIMANIAHKEQEANDRKATEKPTIAPSTSAPKPRTIWVRLRPYLTMAAAVALTIGVFRLFDNNPSPKETQSPAVGQKNMAMEHSFDNISNQDYYEFLTSEYTDNLDGNWLVATEYTQ